MWIQIHKNMDPDPDSAKLSKSQEFSLREKRKKIIEPKTVSSNLVRKLKNATGTITCTGS